MKARLALGAAEMLFEAGYIDDACSRAYYAMFDAARAALLLTGAEPSRTHSGLIAQFGREMIVTGRLQPSLGRALNRAHELLLLADYDGNPIEKHRCAETLSGAKTLLEVVVQLPRESG